MICFELALFRDRLLGEFIVLDVCLADMQLQAEKSGKASSRRRREMPMWSSKILKQHSNTATASNKIHTFSSSLSMSKYKQKPGRSMGPAGRKCRCGAASKQKQAEDYVWSTTHPSPNNSIIDCSFTDDNILWPYSLYIYPICLSKIKNGSKYTSKCITVLDTMLLMRKFST